MYPTHLKRIHLFNLSWRLRFFLFFFLLTYIPTNAQVYSWAKSMGGLGSDRSYNIAVDASGNIYTTGVFRNTADFDPNAGTFNLTSTGGEDIFVSKLDASGNFVWAKSIGGTSNDQGNSIVVDASGNVYTTGFFQGTADFDPGTGVFNLTSAGSYDIFVSKLDASGNFVWAKSIGGTSLDFSNSIAIDASGNVYTTGIFEGTVDFDPNAGVFNLTSASFFGDIFVSKLDASGNFVWAKSMGGFNDDQAYNITIDASGNVYTTGFFQGTADFDPGTGVFNLASAGSYDIFVSKLDASGNFVWAKNMGGTGFDQGNSIVVDASGNVYTTGIFRNTADFDPGTGVFNLTSAGFNDIFVSKLDASGNFVWAKSMGAGGTNDDQGKGIVVDASGNVYTTGFFQGTADFDPDTGVFNLTSAGLDEIFISKLDPSGNFVWAKSMEGTGFDQGYDIAIDASGNIYTTGFFQGAVDFNPGLGVAGLNSQGGDDIFVSKLSPCPTITITTASLPNGTIGSTYSQTISQTGLTGTPAWSVSAGALPNGLSINSSTGAISGTPSATGTFNFTVQVTDGDCSQTKAYSIVISCPTITFTNTTASNATVGTSYNLDASVTGNTQTVTYSVNPALPAGLSLNTSTGVISGTPSAQTASATYTVTASQSAGVCSVTQNYTFAVVCPTASLSPSSLPNGTIGTTYNQTISQTGLPAGTITWSVSLGTLPTGLSLNSSTGVISGTPTATGTFNFTIEASNSGCLASRAYSIVVSCPTITFTNTTALSAVIGTAYSLDASVTGNTTTITYSVSPALPAGLSLNTSTGQITGTPTALATSATYTVTASQSAGVCSVNQNYTFAVNCAGITISPNTLPNVSQLIVYSQTLTQTGLSGTITWSVVSGSLPAGLSLNSSTGVISGISNTSQTANFTIQVSNGACSSTRAYSLTVAPSGALIEINTSNIDFGDVLILQSSIKTINIKNIGIAPLAISSISMPNVVFNGFTGTASIAPNESRDFEVIFTPIAVTSYTGTVTVNSNAVAGTNTFSVKGNGINPTALNPNKNTEVKAYPNPVQDILKVKMLLSEVYDIKIHNLLGKEIKNFQVMNASQEININMADLATGVYLIELVNSKKEKNTIRVVKQ